MVKIPDIIQNVIIATTIFNPFNRLNGNNITHNTPDSIATTVIDNVEQKSVFTFFDKIFTQSSHQRKGLFDTPEEKQCKKEEKKKIKLDNKPGASLSTTRDKNGNRGITKFQMTQHVKFDQYGNPLPPQGSSDFCSPPNFGTLNQMQAPVTSSKCKNGKRWFSKHEKEPFAPSGQTWSEKQQRFIKKKNTNASRPYRWQYDRNALLPPAAPGYDWKWKERNGRKQWVQVKADTPFLTNHSQKNPYMPLDNPGFAKFPLGQEFCTHRMRYIEGYKHVNCKCKTSFFKL